jgi:hypothetical protein
VCGIVERFNSHVGPFGIRQDLFGFIDLISLDPQRGIVGVQCCARSRHAAHRQKIVEDCREEALAWIEAGGVIELWGWGKIKLKRGGKALRWTPRIEVIGKDDLNET